MSFLSKINKNSSTEFPNAELSYGRYSNGKEKGAEERNMTNNQLLDFLDNLDTSLYRHIVMLYEEPEYARLVQRRFINNGLKNGECCVYASPDYDNLSLTKIDLAENGVDIDQYMKKGFLQLHMRSAPVNDSESYKVARSAFQKEIENTFFSAPDHSTAMPPRIRGVGSIFPYIFASAENANSNASAVASQLLVEKFFQSESAYSFSGVWMCAYQVNNISGSMGEEWMKQLLVSHDAVLFLTSLSNGIALDIRK